MKKTGTAMSNRLMHIITEELQRLDGIHGADDRAYAATQVIDVLQRGISMTASVRSASMRELRAQGWTMARIGAVFGISRARVAQIVADGGGPSPDGHAARAPSPGASAAFGPRMPR